MHPNISTGGVLALAQLGGGVGVVICFKRYSAVYLEASSENTFYLAPQKRPCRKISLNIPRKFVFKPLVLGQHLNLSIRAQTTNQIVIKVS